MPARETWWIRFRLAEPAVGRALRCARRRGKPFSGRAEARTPTRRPAHARLDVDRQRHGFRAASDLPRRVVARSHPRRSSPNRPPMCQRSPILPVNPPRRRSPLRISSPSIAKESCTTATPARSLGHSLRALQRHRQVPAAGAEGGRPDQRLQQANPRRPRRLCRLPEYRQHREGRGRRPRAERARGQRYARAEGVPAEASRGGCRRKYSTPPAYLRHRPS